MHILVAKQITQYISDEKTSAIRVEAQLLNPYWMLMPFHIKRAAERARCSPLAPSANSKCRDHCAAVVIGALADGAGRSGGEFEACHHADAERLAGRRDLALRCPQRPEMRSRQPELDQHGISVGADGDDLVGLVGKRNPRGREVAVHGLLAVEHGA